MDTQKRQDLPGLWLIGTPIGNLGDLTNRTIETLNRVDQIWCEDTRVTSKLLSHLEIQKSMIRMDEQVIDQKLDQLVEELKRGVCVGYCSDAGMPGVSDPGARIISRLREEGIPVHICPGVSAVSTAVSLSGLESSQFSFRGYFPRKKIDQLKELNACRSRSHEIYLWFESPKRIKSMIEAIESNAFKCTWVFMKELTKKFEKIWCAESTSDFQNIKQCLESDGERGEWVVLAMSRDLDYATRQRSEGWEKALICLKETGVTQKDTVKIIGHHFGVARNTIYETWLKIDSKKTPS